MTQNQNCYFASHPEITLNCRNLLDVITTDFSPLNSWSFTSTRYLKKEEKKKKYNKNFA